MAKVKAEELQTKVKVLKAKVQEADKNTDKSKLAEARTLHKSLKRAQRKIRALTGKKLPAKKEEEGKKEAPAAAPVATAPVKTPEPAAKPAVEPAKPADTPAAPPEEKKT